MDALVVAAETSGDAHGAAVVRELRAARRDLTVFGMGGRALETQGMEVLHPASAISVMGFTEVVPKLFAILRILRDLGAAAEVRKPDFALLVDAPDFNLRLARRLHRVGIPVFTFAAPSVWAWREGRTAVLREIVRHVLCILPFEQAYFRDRSVQATYVGNPLLDELPPPAPPHHFRRALGLPEMQPVLALLPGSRETEIRRHLTTLLTAGARVQAQVRGASLVVPIAPGLRREIFEDALRTSGVSAALVDGRASEVLGACDVAIVASGTATLEAALMQRPMVAVYRMSPLSHAIARALVTIPYVSLVNILAQRQLVPELIQSEATSEAIASAALGLWDGPARNAALHGYEEIRTSLGPPGAAARAARLILADVD